MMDSESAELAQNFYFSSVIFSFSVDCRNIVEFDLVFVHIQLGLLLVEVYGGLKHSMHTVPFPLLLIIPVPRLLLLILHHHPVNWLLIPISENFTDHLSLDIVPELLYFFFRATDRPYVLVIRIDVEAHVGLHLAINVEGGRSSSRPHAGAAFKVLDIIELRRICDRKGFFDN